MVQKMTPAEFKTIRKNANLSVNQLADMVGLNERTIRRYEYGECSIHKPVQILMGLIKEGKLR